MVKIKQILDIKSQFELIQRKVGKSSMLPKPDGAHKSSGKSNAV